jgi:hypothetical protein
MLLIASFYVLSGVFEKKIRNNANVDSTKESADLLRKWLGVYNEKGEQTNAAINNPKDFSDMFKAPLQKKLGLIDTNISFIQSSLENIERAEISAEDINGDFYIPLKEHLESFPELEKVKVHMGLEKDNFMEAGAIHGIDMTNKYNQTRYLHTLSVLAGACKEEHVNMSEIERCFVEWPPKIQYKMGQVNEI